MKKTTSKFYEEVKFAKQERHVEDVYNKGIALYFPDTRIENPYGCDGYVETEVKYDTKTKILRLLIEYKFDEDFSSKIHQSKVIIQALYYMKKFEVAGQPLPNVILIGDKNECFILHANDLIDYLDEKINWNIAPSEAAHKNPNLILKLTKDTKINPFIFTINEKFSFRDVTEKIKEMALHIQRFVRITQHNIATIYDYFITKVVKDISKHNANDLVYMFIDLMVSPRDNYKHPTKKNTLVLSNKNEIGINGSSFDSFFNHFERKYSPHEKEIFTEIADRLIEDTTRRFKGEFYTPTIWVDEAHKIISTSFDDNWKEEYVVWDCAWGTGNLTRDYHFKDLYCSTLNENDLKMGSRYNINATKFQYDFLNYDIDFLEQKNLLEEEFKLPKQLLSAFKENKPIIFLINPPYGTANNAGTKNGDHKEGIALTGVNALMKKDNMGACSQQLYAQFLYRILLMKKIYNLTNVNICIYAKSSYMTASTFKKFRNIFLKNFKYDSGMLFQASHFSDVKGMWGIDFSVWKSGETKNKKEFLHALKDIDDTNTITTTSYKYLYNMDDTKSCSDWIKEEVKKLKTYDAPQLGSALIVKNKGVGKLVENALGYYVNVGNSVYKNTTDVFIVSSTSSMGHGVSILPENLLKITSNFAARKLITGKFANWINDKDEYLIPNTEHCKYMEWVGDSIIYSIFNTSSAQSSLRKIKYNNVEWNITNQFFFMDSKELSYLANEFDNDDVYTDVRNFNGNRYIYNILKDKKLSQEAQDVLYMARDLVRKSFKYRDIFNDDSPEYHINTWDAGWYQIKGLLSEYMKDELKEFNLLYKILEDKMRPLVYELGFLKDDVSLLTDKYKDIESGAAETIKL